MRNEGKEERKTEEVRELCPGAKLKLGGWCHQQEC